jgi:hypothetical protein
MGVFAVPCGRTNSHDEADCRLSQRLEYEPLSPSLNQSQVLRTTGMTRITRKRKHCTSVKVKLSHYGPVGLQEVEVKVKFSCYRPKQALGDPEG